MGSRAAKLREMNDEELKHLLDEKEKELQMLRVRKVGKDGGAIKPAYQRVLRREIARLLTLLHERGVHVHG